MRRRYLYLISLLLVFVLPTTVLGFFVVPNIPLSNLALFAASITILGSIWDIWATRHGKRDVIWLWQFNHRDTLGIRIFDLPVEEYLFYICSSTYVVFLWEGIRYGQTTGSVLALILISFSGVWSLLAIAIPYVLRAKNDRL